MFCSNCGNKLDDNAKFCSNCGNQAGTISMPKLNNSDKEIVIKEGLCNRIKSKLFVENGHGLLTNKGSSIRNIALLRLQSWAF